MLRVGLTGGIACGKSHVLRRLAASGIHTLDLDLVAREVVASGQPALAQLRDDFGPGVIARDGSLDRKALARIVFADPAARARLDAIVHPWVRNAERRWADALPPAPGAIAVTDAALLVEAGLHLRFDRLVVVHCAPELQLERLRARSGLDEAGARARVAAQMPVAEKREFAHYAVDTSGQLEDTDRAADALALQLRTLAAGRARCVTPSSERLLGMLAYGPRSGPRGLSPERVLALAAERGAPELVELCRTLDPPASGPWYRAVVGVAPGAPAATLAAALVAWAALRAPGPDEEFLASAAVSLARLTHDDPAERADACLFALVLQRALSEADQTSAEAARLLTPLAQRWGRGGLSGRLRPVWDAADRFPARPAAAGAACRAAGGEQGLAAALAGAAAGLDRALAPPALAAALESMVRAAR